MKCKQVQERLPLYIESDLDASDTTAVGAHVIDCVECGHLLEDYRESQSWLRDYAPEPEQSFVDSVASGVASRIAWSKSNGLSFVKTVRLNRWLLVAAVTLIALVAATGWYFVRHSAKTDPQRDNPIESRDNKRPLPGEIPNEENKSIAATPPTQDDNGTIKPRQVKKQPADLHRTDNDRSEAPEPPPGTDSAPQTNVAVDAAPEEGLGPAGLSAVAFQAGGLLRVEIHTSDANIRIIWFAPSSAQSSAP